MVEQPTHLGECPQSLCFILTKQGSFKKYAISVADGVVRFARVSGQSSKSPDLTYGAAEL